VQIDQSREASIKSIDREFALVIDERNWGDGVLGGRAARKRSRRPCGCQLGPDANLEAWIRLKLDAGKVQGK
jgi:hypothetical protein